jgi:hypothetical protein
MNAFVDEIAEGTYARQGGTGSAEAEATEGAPPRHEFAKASVRVAHLSISLRAGCGIH